MAEEAIVKTIQNYLRSLAIQNIPIKFGVLFGSQARYAGHADSDIDVIIVSTLFDRDKSLDKRLELWRIAARVDSRIEPIACGLKQWGEDAASTIIEIARREGMIIYPELAVQPVP